ncbi:Uma2 family endonuclease [Leptolyngbya sp. AN03gr2]|uniref:Uma2 family endonuclease n=1 Tax=unclassified Leptolyngbya TaxID=2650499 RepID=UPI003D31F792
MQTQIKRVTPEEYLELERKADFRSEYRNGEIIQMTGGSANHNTIFINWCALLKMQLRGKNAKVFGGDLRLWIPDFRLYTYPDVMVIQGEPIFHDDRKDIVTNPSLIVEVLSKSTQEYDRSDKFKMYRSIPEFQEYVLINQYRVEIEHYAKTSEGWLLRDYGADTKSISLRSLGLEFAIADLYEGVTFEQD